MLVLPGNPKGKPDEIKIIFIRFSGSGFDTMTRDTELLMPKDKVALGCVADNPGKWLLHCHTLEYTAAGMITWFEVMA